MIQPNMATMLGFLATDAAISPALLSRALRAVVERTFNAITVDGDTSTNDTVTLLANGASGAPKITNANDDWKKFCAALELVCQSLALQIVADGEGARHVIEIEVRGAPTRSRRKANRAHHREFAAGKNRHRRRRSQLGPHPRRRRPLRRRIRFPARRYFPRRRESLPPRPRKSLRRTRRASQNAREVRSHRRLAAFRRRPRARLDLRFHRRIHSHQRQLSHLARAARSPAAVVDCRSLLQQDAPEQLERSLQPGVVRGSLAARPISCLFSLVFCAGPRAGRKRRTTVKKLYVGNLSFKATEEQIAALVFGNWCAA